MEYNDFLSPTEDDIKLMNDYYNNLTFDIDQNISEIFALFNLTQNELSTIPANMNFNIKNTLSELKSLLTTNIHNFEELFKTKIETQKITNFNLFDIISNLILIQQKLFIWNKNEKKEFYKNFSYKTFLEINKILEKILKILKNNNILMFKYM